MELVTVHGHQWARIGRGGHTRYVLVVGPPDDPQPSPIHIGRVQERVHAPQAGRPRRTRLVWKDEWYVAVDEDQEDGGIKVHKRRYYSRDDAMRWGLEKLKELRDEPDS